MESLKNKFENYFEKNPIMPALLLSGVFSLVYIFFCVNVYDDLAAYYGPMARAFGRGDWNKAFIDFIPPLQPVLAGLLCKIGIHCFTALKIVSCIFFVASVFPTYFILKKILKREIYAGLGCLMYVLVPSIIRLSCMGLLNSGRNFFVLWSVWIVISFIEKQSWKKIILLGVSLAGLTLIRGEGIAYFPFFLLWLCAGLWFKRRKFSLAFWADAFKYSLVTIIIMLAIMTPRMVQVYRSTGIAVVDFRQAKLAAKILNIKLKKDKKTSTAPRPAFRHAPVLSAEKLKNATERFFEGSYPLYLVLAIIGLIILARNKQFEFTHWMLLSTVIFTFIIFYPVPISTRYYSLNIPLLAGFSFIGLKFIYEQAANKSIHLKRTVIIVLIILAGVQTFSGLKKIRSGTSVNQKRVSMMLAEKYKDKSQSLTIASEHPQYALWADCDWINIVTDESGNIYPAPDKLKQNADLIIAFNRDRYMMSPLEKLDFLKTLQHEDQEVITVFENKTK